MRTTKDEIREMADARSWQRGIAYFLEERVSGLLHDGDTAIASVQGELLYRVRLSRHDGRLHGECSCPVGVDGDFCKHCVAVGLACAEDEVSPARDDSGTGVTANRPTPTDDPALSEMNRIRQYLSGRDSVWLVEKLIAAAENDLALLRQLRMEAAQSGDAVDMRAMKRAITDATRTHGFVDYRESPDFARGIHAVIDSIAGLLAQDRADEAIELSEHALRRVERALGQMDDSDGYMRPILNDLQALHHAACVAARPNAVRLARQLFEWEVGGDWDVFHGAVRTYADVLGAAGIAEYRRLAEAEWGKVPQLGPGRERDAYAGPRFRLTAIMEALEAGDVEALVLVKTRDLSSSYRYLDVAQTYADAGMDDKALAWAEDGVNAFPNDPVSLLRDFLAAEYERLERHEDALAIAWQSFCCSPNVKAYAALKLRADRVGSWPHWRERALACLRSEQVQHAPVRRPGRALSTGQPVRRITYGSAIVAVLLWEGDVEAAWEEASQNGCALHQWEKLAQLRETTHVEDSLRIYEESVHRLVDQTNNSAYEEAFQHVLRIQRLLVGNDRPGQFLTYVTALRGEFGRKRNFMRLLDGIVHPPA